MTRASPLRSHLRRAGLPALALIAMGFFIYHALLGPNGVLEYDGIRRDLHGRETELQQLRQRVARMQNRVDLLDARKGADPDLVDELARKQLNVARPDEVIVPLQ